MKVPRFPSGRRMSSIWSRRAPGARGSEFSSRAWNASQTLGAAHDQGRRRELTVRVDGDAPVERGFEAAEAFSVRRLDLVPNPPEEVLRERSRRS